MLQQFLVEAIEAMLRSPVLDSIPVRTLVHNAEVRPWAMEVGKPVKRLQHNVRIAHDVLTKTVQAARMQTTQFNPLNSSVALS